MQTVTCAVMKEKGKVLLARVVNPEMPMLLLFQIRSIHLMKFEK